jgi:uncharacterized membrane protein YgcG
VDEVRSSKGIRVIEEDVSYPVMGVCYEFTHAKPLTVSRRCILRASGLKLFYRHALDTLPISLFSLVDYRLHSVQEGVDSRGRGIDSNSSGGGIRGGGGGGGGGGNTVEPGRTGER